MDIGKLYNNLDDSCRQLSMLTANQQKMFTEKPSWPVSYIILYMFIVFFLLL